MIPNAGSPMYIPKLSAINDSPRTSDSDSAFSINDNVEIIGVSRKSYNASLKVGALSVPYVQCMMARVVDSSNAVIEISS